MTRYGLFSEGSSHQAWSIGARGSVAFALITLNFMGPEVLCLPTAAASFAVETRITMYEDEEGVAPTKLFDEAKVTAARSASETAEYERVAEIPSIGAHLIGEVYGRIRNGREVKLYSRAQITSTVEGVKAYEVLVFNRALLYDTITVDAPPEAPGLNGQPGILELPIHVSGEWYAEAISPSNPRPDNQASTSWRLGGYAAGQLIAWAGGPGAVGGDLLLRDITGNRGTISGFDLEEPPDFVGKIAFTYGEPFQFSPFVRAEAEASFVNPRSGAILSEINLKNTVVLLPFTNFGADPDGDGQFEPLMATPIVSADSGIDYLTAVPSSPELQLQRGQLGWELVWDRGILESTRDLASPDWKEVLSAASPWLLSGAISNNQFYRVRVDN